MGVRSQHCTFQWPSAEKSKQIIDTFRREAREGIERAWADGVQRWQKTAPLKRLGLPEDIADACLFLASPGARWITGASLLVDGGVMTHQIF